MKESCADELLSSSSASRGETVTKICSYCEEHRKLRETLRSLRNQRSNYSRSLTTDDATSSVRKIEQQATARRIRSPSCLKSSVDSCKSAKRVDFHIEHRHESKSSVSARLAKTNSVPSSASAAAARDRSATTTALPNEHFTRGRFYGSRDLMAESDGTSITHGLDRLSLTSSGGTCCATKPPKIVRAKDSLNRAAARRLMVYPPDGQSGPPLTLLRQWSNLECRVSGDPRRGYKYKVYYLQEYESDRWLPDDGTGGPFQQQQHRRDEWTTTDCG